MASSTYLRCNVLGVPLHQRGGRFPSRNRKARFARDSTSEEATSPPLSSPPPMQKTSPSISEKVQHERRGEQEPSDDGRVDPRDPLLRPSRRGCSSGGGDGHMEEDREGKTESQQREKKCVQFFYIFSLDLLLFYVPLSLRLPPSGDLPAALLAAAGLLYS